jgi:YVTN family beta-propeller protein
MQRSLIRSGALFFFCCLAPAFCQHVVATIAVGNQPIYLAVDEQRNRVYVSNQADNTISVIDGATNTVLRTVRVGHSPNGVAVNQKTNTIYVANLTGASLSIINGTKLTTSTLRLGPYPAKVAVNPFTDRVYVTLESRNGFLDVIAGKERRLKASIPLPPYPLSVAVDVNSNLVYVADFLCGCGQISVVDGTTDSVTNTIDVPGASLLEGIALDWKHDRAYATDENKGFYVIDPTSGTVLGKIGELHDPNEIAAIPGTTLAVEPDTGSNRAVFIDAATLAVKKRVRVGNFPTGVAVNAATKRVYVANRGSNNVSVIQLPRGW